MKGTKVMKWNLQKFSPSSFMRRRSIRKRFFIEQARGILEEHDKISAKNKVDRENLLASQTAFQQQFTDAQSNIQTARAFIQKTMR